MGLRGPAGLKPSRSVKSKSTRAGFWRSTGRKCRSMAISGTSHPTFFDAMESELTPCAEGFHAKTFRSRERELASQGRGRDYGSNMPELLARYDPKSSSWRTSQLCWVEGSESYSETWPRSGIQLAGTAFLLPHLAPLTDETGSGLWQTPVADDAVNRSAGKWNSRGEPRLSAQVKMFPTPRAAARKYPTP